MESQLVSEFMLKTGSNQNDAISCLKTWGFDLKRAITDYKDTCKNDFQQLVPSQEENWQPNATPNSYLTTAQKRPLLLKSDSIDIVDCRKLSRGISRATDNANLVSRARTEFAMDFHNNYQKNLEKLQAIDSPDYTFVLPNILNYPDPFRCFLEKDLIECSTLSALEQTHRLNWWVESGTCRKLWPLSTTGDGNCLLHAASLGMWGFHDRKLTLRSALHNILSKGQYRDALFRRWRFQQTRFNRAAGFVYSEAEWIKEWGEIVAIASPEPRNYAQKESRRRISSASDRNSLIISSDSFDNTAATYESLEEVHILALAHILRRTIIVISDTVLRDINGEAMAPIPFGGIYLPFEINASECNRGPLLLAYDMAHFSALVTMETQIDYPPPLIPLTDFENVLLPIQFCIDPGENFDWQIYDGSEGNWVLTYREHIALLQEYLNIVYAGSNGGSPDDELYDDISDEDFEKRFSESEVTIPNSSSSTQMPNNIQNAEENQTTSKSKAAKQLQNVAKQFGSIGKSMSKKIKKNIGTITKIAGKNNQKKSNMSSANSTQSFTCTKILCARLRVKRHEFQEEMIRNYLECAHNRFLESEKTKNFSEFERQHLERLSIKEPDKNEEHVFCINAGCNNYGTSETSYLCHQCFEKQHHRESSAFLNTAPRYGTGKSKFYTQADVNSHDSIRQLPSVRRLNELDQTLYLSNSTFYNDNLPRYNEIGIPNNESFYRHGYSPTVKLTEISDHQDEPDGTVSVFSLGNTLNQKQHDNVSVGLTVADTSNTTVTGISSPVANNNNMQARPCRTIGCMFYGSPITNFYCSKCCQANSENSFNTNIVNTSSSKQPTIIYPTATATIAKTNSKIMSDI